MVRKGKESTLGIFDWAPAFSSYDGVSLTSSAGFLYRSEESNSPTTVITASCIRTKNRYRVIRSLVSSSARSGFYWPVSSSFYSEKSRLLLTTYAGNPCCMSQKNMPRRKLKFTTVSWRAVMRIIPTGFTNDLSSFRFFIFWQDWNNITHRNFL